MADDDTTNTATTIDTSMDGTQTEVVREPETQEAAKPVVDVEAAVRAREAELRKEFEATKQAAIDSAVQKRLARERRGKPNGTKDEPPVQTQTTEDPDLSTLTKRELHERMDLNRRFDRAQAKHASHLSERQLTTMEAAFLAEKPDHLDEWMAEYLGEMGWAKPTTSPAQRETATTGASSANGNGTPVKKPNPQAVDNAAPAGQISWKQVTDPTQLTKEQIQAIYTELGVRKGQHKIREMWETWGKNVRVVPG